MINFSRIRYNWTQQCTQTHLNLNIRSSTRISRHEISKSHKQHSQTFVVHKFHKQLFILSYKTFFYRMKITTRTIHLSYSWIRVFSQIKYNRAQKAGEKRGNEQNRRRYYTIPALRNPRFENKKGWKTRKVERKRREKDFSFAPTLLRSSILTPTSPAF